MRIDIITLFPEMFSGPFDESIVRIAQEQSLVEINFHNLRKWAVDKHGTVDDKPYGGGIGMVLRPEPIFNAVEDILGESVKGPSPSIILLSASGTPYTQKKAQQLSKLKHLILICGRYEGVDQRVSDHLADEEISIGDYVLTGGEIPAMVIVDSVIRLLPGVLEQDATENESFSQLSTPIKSGSKVNSQQSLLEYPHYTRPEVFKSHKTPKILLSGNHREIEKWRLEKAMEKTKKVRPELLKQNF